jgi:divalent metal cation (Fe/Co/Zn/Cd) transporter
MNKKKSFLSLKYISSNEEKDGIKIHLIVDKDMSIKDSHELCHRLESTVQREYGPYSMNIHFDPCGKDCRIISNSCWRRLV